jgi:hypothetical protein
MESGLKRLLDRREALRRQKLAADQELEAIDRALNIMEFKVDDPDFVEIEDKYRKEKPFKSSSLAEACSAIMYDCASSSILPIWLDKNEVEHLLEVGGYRFGKGDATNSIEVTLRRLAAAGKCAVQKRGGPHGSKYSAKGAEEIEDDVNSRATKK